jgi:predicted nuclease of predicted toxin-antitoxin system
MRVLLDECVTRYLKRDFTGHNAFTVEDAGFKGLKNGRLLQAASGQYDVLVTVDQNLTYQQNLKSFSVAVIVLSARRSTYAALRPLMPKVLEALDGINPGDVVTVRM